MTNDDDHRKNGLDEDPPPTSEEVEAARALAAATERLLDGAPGADRETEELATARMIRAAVAEEHLSATRRDALISAAVGRSAARPLSTQMRRAAPYAAFAASLVLLLASILVQTGSVRRAPASPASPEQLLSRPSNDLIGQPFVDRGGASSRLDLVFADRLSGYRELRLLARASDTRGTP